MPSWRIGGAARLPLKPYPELHHHQNSGDTAFGRPFCCALVLLVALAFDTALDTTSSVGIKRLQLGAVIRIYGTLIKPCCFICGTRRKSFIPACSAVDPRINLPAVLAVRLPIILHVYLRERR